MFAPACISRLDNNLLKFSHDNISQMRVKIYSLDDVSKVGNLTPDIPELPRTILWKNNIEYSVSDNVISNEFEFTSLAFMNPLIACGKSNLNLN